MKGDARNAVGRLLFAVLLLAGCATDPPRSSRLTLGDYDMLVAHMSQSLASSELFATRTPNTPPIYITINKVENLTSDVIPPAEQWMLMARVRSSVPLLALRRERNVTFQITPERFAMLRDAGFNADLGTDRDPTHIMRAVYRAAPRAATGEERYVDERTDYYFLEYQITELASRKVVWADHVEFKRSAKGLVID